MNRTTISALILALMTATVTAAPVVINLGSVTIPDNPEPAVTQQNLMDWLDEAFDPANAGGQYVARMRVALRAIGIRGVQRRVKEWKQGKAMDAAGLAVDAATDIIDLDPDDPGQ